MAQLTMYPAKAGSKRTTLTSDLAIDGTQAFVGDLSAFPPAPNLATLQSDATIWETCLYTEKSAESGAGYLTITRSGEGHDSSASGAALSWSSGAIISRNPCALDHDRFKANIEDIAANTQPLDATLTALSGITTAANKLPFFTGVDTADVCDITAMGRSILGTTTETAVRELLRTASITTEDRTIYIDSSATGDADGTSKANAFTTFAAMWATIPRIVDHAITITVCGNTPYTGGVGDFTPVCTGSGSITIQAEYYWYGTNASSKTGKFDLGSSDFGYNNRAQIEAGDTVTLIKWSGTKEASAPLESFTDTVASVSGTEITLATNSGKELTTAWTYRIVKTSVGNDSGGISMINGLVNATIKGLKLTGSTAGISVQSLGRLVLDTCNIITTAASATSIFLWQKSIGTFYRTYIESSQTKARGFYLVGSDATIHAGCIINLTGASSIGIYSIRGGMGYLMWGHIKAANVGISTQYAGFCQVLASLNEGTTPKSPASSTDPTWIS